ncbi:NrfD/PsrC family molybdoenzyme membrane anchor subunit [Acidocella sp.]|uniref:NrfD/PsrC family molybdoenzyme membrane anchor subunit n=1 Tax=Acidocella sp. TaxID=50710 RepID=UPI00262D82EA|nr:NrfD/PsrC family molybdoenzyme membrane anchor subunit [Acidocella sp.]
MHEELLASVMANPSVVPQMAIWGWQIAVYLFLGGFTAGLMVFSGWTVLSGREEQAPFAARRAPMVAFIALSLGMTTLFLDLSHKLNVWRFYTTLHVTSPMSWGSWVLVLVFPALIVAALDGLPLGFPGLAARLTGLPKLGKWAGGLLGLCRRLRGPAALLNVALGMALGIYTGILLSSFNARPFWHSALLGPLFLVSGLSTGAAMMVLASPKAGERHMFGRIDLGLIVLESAILGLYMSDMLTGDLVQQQAVGFLLGGAGARLFWLGFVPLGLGVPLLLEAAMWRRSLLIPGALAALMVLSGGFLLRGIVIAGGQETGWVTLQNQFNPALLGQLGAIPAPDPRF